MVSLSGEKVYPEGSIIELPLSLGERKKAIARIEEFVVINSPSTYNAILGRLAIYHFNAVPLTYHKVMKFPTPNGIASVVG